MSIKFKEKNNPLEVEGTKKNGSNYLLLLAPLEKGVISGDFLRQFADFP